jgi:hypothetical protein
VSLTERLRVLLVCITLEFGVIMGAPVRPDEIRELMHQLNQPTLAHVLPGEEEDGDDPLERAASL